MSDTHASVTLKYGRHHWNEYESMTITLTQNMLFITLYVSQNLKSLGQTLIITDSDLFHQSVYLDHLTLITYSLLFQLWVCVPRPPDTNYILPSVSTECVYLDRLTLITYSHLFRLSWKYTKTAGRWVDGQEGQLALAHVYPLFYNKKYLK